jgi:hypothetical protein
VLNTATGWNNFGLSAGQPCGQCIKCWRVLRGLVDGGVSCVQMCSDSAALILTGNEITTENCGKNRIGRAMAQVISRRPVTAKARVRTRVNPCGICGGQSGTGTGFSPSSSVFPCQCIIPPSLSKLISSGECVIC